MPSMLDPVGTYRQLYGGPLDGHFTAKSAREQLFGYDIIIDAHDRENKFIQPNEDDGGTKVRYHLSHDGKRYLHFPVRKVLA